MRPKTSFCDWCSMSFLHLVCFTRFPCRRLHSLRLHSQMPSPPYTLIQYQSTATGPFLCKCGHLWHNSPEARFIRTPNLSRCHLRRRRRRMETKEGAGAGNRELKSEDLRWWAFAVQRPNMDQRGSNVRQVGSDNKTKEGKEKKKALVQVSSG